MEGSLQAQSYTLDGELFVIGRHPNCDVVLADDHVSKRHATIARKNGQYFLRDGDLGAGKPSHNGTKLNGYQLKKDDNMRLEPGDEIKVHDTVFVFQTPLIRVRTDEESPSTVLGTIDLSSISSVREPRQQKAAELLRAVLGVSQDIATTLSTAELLERTLESLFELFPQAERGFILLRPDDHEKGELSPQAYRFRGDSPRQWRLSQNVYRRVLDEGEAILSKDVQDDSRFRESGSLAESDVRTMICVPLHSVKRSPIGMIQVDTSNPERPFSSDDLDLLAGLAGPVSLALENSRLHEKLVRFIELETELRLAQDVQKSLLPKSRPQVEGYEFWDHYEPAKSIGGDHFDYLPVSRPGSDRIDSSLWAITIADISGKGLPAALFMARLSTEVRYIFLQERDPARVVEALDRHLDDPRVLDRFITLVLLILDPVSHALTLVNAGHPMPLIRRAATGAVEALGDGDFHPPLCAVRGYRYTSVSTTLNPGDLVLLTTDGVEEAMNLQGEKFGEDRIIKTLASSLDNAAGAGIALLQAVRLHAAGAGQSDDIALVCFRRL
jgi:serine phosphatase RsbU (regulator of sigma subunit)/pSer/pThr/pTyr-binding forkhead associated (FHA) protein